ncbi:MAG: putative signal transducing protein [Candidatus Cyclobacteriaceae bacterium M3_2C_046]
MKNWQKVYVSGKEYRAEIVKAILEEKDIPAVVVNKKDSAYLLGNFEVYVSPDDLLKAINIVNNDIEFK